MQSLKYRETFSRKNIRTTKQREAILDILMNSEGPLSVEAIFAQLAEKEKRMSLSTIYRILDVFISKGLAVRSNLHNNRAVFELKGKRHKHHLTCVSCGKVLVLDNCPLKGYERTLEEKTRFDITSHSLEFFGLCLECKTKKEGNTQKRQK